MRQEHIGGGWGCKKAIFFSRQAARQSEARFAKKVSATIPNGASAPLCEQFGIIDGMPASSLQEAFEIALTHHQSGRLQQAAELYRQILGEDPQHAGALHYLGVIAAQSGEKAAAVELLRQAVKLSPDTAEAQHNLGSALKDNGDLDEAIAAYRRAIALLHDYPEAHNNLGKALSAKGLMDEAIAAYREAIALRPDYADAYNNLGRVLLVKGQARDAAASFARAADLDPSSADAHYNLGLVLHDNGHFDLAVTAVERALQLRPNYAEAHCQMGVSYFDRMLLDEAIAANRRAIALNPGYAPAHNNLGNGLKDIGHLEEALAAYRESLALEPKATFAHSNYLLALHYAPGVDPMAIADEHRRWNQQHAAQFTTTFTHTNERDPDRRLRVGYVSPDLRGHAVTRFLLPILANHDRDACEIFAYANVRKPDATTDRLRKYTDGWRSISGLSDDQAADLIREDSIDILVDLAGHTSEHRLLVFARKPAPVQITYLGYPDTTGLTAMDYRLTDAHADPPGLTERYHTEQLIRLKPCAWCFRPKAAQSLPHRKNGPITFGSFNTFAKITQPMLELWSKILLAVPGSGLLLKCTALGTATLPKEVRERMGAMGIAPERLELRGRVRSDEEHLALYGRMDIALDTFPYHGTTTTCEALWMGVPVITLAGASHVSRVGVSLLNNVGLPELVAETTEDYVRLAAALAHDLPRLRGLQSTLRQRLERSPLMDGARFARNVEAAYRDVWRSWCQSNP
jgi:predicted O-linked N-acetylglucosamine transferase (SPINDLY family)